MNRKPDSPFTVRSRTAAWTAVSLGTVAFACAESTLPPPGDRLEIVSDVYTIDRKYQSMQGPSGNAEIAILPDEPGEIVWITGYHARVVGEDGSTPVAPEFMCHSNMGFDAKRHARLFNWSKRTASRLFTVSQGQPSVKFPEGFGIPVMSDELLTVSTQVLNHNHPDTTLNVRVRVTIDYVRDRELSQPLVPLYMKSANALVSLEEHDGYYGVQDPEPSVHGSGSHAGMQASGRVIRDKFGRTFSGHWIVPPGRQENTTLVTNWMNLPEDGTVHYISVHLHPFATSLTLRDRTTGASIFSATADGFPDRIGLDRVTSFASADGARLPADHEYELTSVYSNTSGEDQEAMAVMYLYLRDNEFRRPVSSR